MAAFWLYVGYVLALCALLPLAGCRGNPAAPTTSSWAEGCRTGAIAADDPICQRCYALAHDTETGSGGLRVCREEGWNE